MLLVLSPSTVVLGGTIPKFPGSKGATEAPRRSPRPPQLQQKCRRCRRNSTKAWRCWELLDQRSATLWDSQSARSAAISKLFFSIINGLCLYARQASPPRFVRGLFYKGRREPLHVETNATTAALNRSMGARSRHSAVGV